MMREDWVEVELGAVILQTKEKHSPTKKELLFYIGLEHIAKDSGSLVDSVGFELIETVKNKFEKGNILYGKLRPYLNKVYLAQQSGVCSTDILVYESTSVIESKYAVLYMLSRQFVNDMSANTSGVNLPRVSTSFVNAYRIPLAPLPIQRAIVLKIENLFASLDKGIADLKTAQAQLKVYRQAVLKKAFEGGFTCKNVKEGELPEGWKWVKSGDLFSYVTSGSRGWAKYYSNDGAIFVRITNLDFDTLELNLSSSKIQYVQPPDNSEGQRTKIQEGDFLFSITGYLGMFAIAPKLNNAYVNQHVSLCRPKDGFNKKYVGYWIISKAGGHRFLNENQKGAVKAGLNLDDLKGIPVPLPPSLAEQHAIVREIESRLSVCDKVEQSITEALEKAEALRQSILKKAFEGKLLSEAEIARCKQESDYEPASVLMERIKAIKRK